MTIACVVAAVDEQNDLNLEGQGAQAGRQQPTSLPIPQICIPDVITEPIPSTSTSGWLRFRFHKDLLTEIPISAQVSKALFSEG